MTNNEFVAAYEQEQQDLYDGFYAGGNQPEPILAFTTCDCGAVEVPEGDFPNCFCMRPKAYRPGLTTEDIIGDGWSRDLDHEQIVEEARSSGYTITREEVVAEYKRLDVEFSAWAKKHHG